MRTKPIVSFTIDDTVAKQLDEESKRTRVPKSRIVNDVLRSHFKGSVPDEGAVGST